MIPWTAPESTFAIATSQIGHGAWTRSSISRVKPNSCAMDIAIDWTPWNMTEMPTTPGTRIVANADSSAVPCATDALPDLGEHVEEHEAEQERLDQRAKHELHSCLRSTTRSRRSSAPRAVQLAAATERVGT